MIHLTRRTMLKATTAAIAAPAVLRAHDALAQSGQVNVYAWGDYFDKNKVLDAFAAKTGIKVNLSTYGSNGELENKLRAAGGKGFDIVFPSVDNGPNYYKDNLLQPINESKLKVEQIIPAIYRNSLSLGAANRGVRHLVPFDWGTEAITYDSSKLDKKSGELSWGDLFAHGQERKTMARATSLLVSAALFLDASGKMASNRGLDLYKDEASSRKTFDTAYNYLKDQRKQLGAFWTNATEATKAFTDGGCTIGQTWDTTGILLNRSTDKKWKYGMPKEGGLAWTDTMAIPAGAANVDQAYEFMNFVFQPEQAAAFANASGYNSCAVGAEKFLDDNAKAGFQMAYPTQKEIDNLWWWPMATEFYGKIRSEYAEKLVNTP